MPKRNIHHEDIVFAKKQLAQVSSLKGKVEDMRMKWEGQVGTGIPDYHLLVSQLETVEKQIFEQIGTWNRAPTIRVPV